MLIEKGSHMDLNALPGIFKLITLKHTLPMSNAGVETSFSAMNRILDKKKNRLSQINMNNFIVISANRDILKKLDVDALCTKGFKEKYRYGTL